MLLIATDWGTRCRQRPAGCDGQGVAVGDGGVAGEREQEGGAKWRRPRWCRAWRRRLTKRDPWAAAAHNEAEPVHEEHQPQPARQHPPAQPVFGVI